MLHFNTTDFKGWERFYRANFFNSIGGFKPLNLIGTTNKQGVHNVAPFFSVLHLGANPALLGVLFRPHTVPRHTLENILKNGYFTVNAVDKSIYQKAHQAAAKYETEVSEFEAVGLRPKFSTNCKAPFVAESKVAVGCRLEEDHHIAANDTILIVGRIMEAFVDQTALGSDGFIEHDAVDTVTVNGLDAYYQPQKIDRLSYPRPNQPLHSLKDE